MRSCVEILGSTRSTKQNPWPSQSLLWLMCLGLFLPALVGIAPPKPTYIGYTYKGFASIPEREENTLKIWIKPPVQDLVKSSRSRKKPMVMVVWQMLLPRYLETPTYYMWAILGGTCITCFHRKLTSSPEKSWVGRRSMFFEMIQVTCKYSPGMDTQKGSGRSSHGKTSKPNFQREFSVCQPG